MKKTEFLTVRVTAETKQGLLELAERQERTIGWIVNRAVAEYLERFKQKKVKDEDKSR